MQLTSGRIITGMVIVMLLGGLFLAYDASRHGHSTFDVSITRYVQSWAPGVGSSLRVISEITNFWPGVAIWTATFVLLFWKGLRIEAFTLLLAVGTFLSAVGSLSHKSPSLIYAKTVMTISDFNTMHWCVIQLKISLFPRKRESTEGGLGRRLTSETGSRDLFIGGSPWGPGEPAPSFSRAGPRVAKPSWKRFPQRPRLWSCSILWPAWPGTALDGRPSGGCFRP